MVVSSAAATIAYLWAHDESDLKDRYLIGSTLILVAIFMTFYHVNSEYFIFVVPLLIVMASRVLDHIVAYAISILAWAINFFEGVHFQTRVAIHEGKSAFIDIYTVLIPFPPETALLISRIAFIGLCFGVLVHLIRSLGLPAFNSPPRLSARTAE